MTTLLIADDHKIFREGLTVLLENEPNLKIIAEASNGLEVIELLKSITPDLILLDIEMPKLDGFDVLRQIKGTKTKSKILVLTMHNSPEFIRNIFRSGASGYIQKDAGSEALINAIFKIAKEGTYITPEISKILIKNLGRTTRSSEVSKREKEIIKLVVNQHTTTEISDILHISPHTVESHRQNILLKLGLKNTAGLVKYAVQRGII